MEKTIGKYKPEIKFIEFLGIKGNINFISNEAIVEAKYLSGLDLEGVKFKLTICDEGTVNFDEVDTDVTTEEQRGRLLNILLEKTITPARGKMVITDVVFTSVPKEGMKEINLYLAVDYKTPIQKLADLFNDMDEEEEAEVDVSNEQNTMIDAFLSMFDEDEVEEEKSEGVVIVDVISEETISNAKSMLEESFARMKQEKLEELQRELDKQKEELKKTTWEKTSSEKKIETINSEISLLESRLEQMAPAKEANGYIFFVSERLNEKINLDDETSKLIISKISKVKTINVKAFMKLFEDGEYRIYLATKTDGVLTEVEDYLKLPTDIQKSIYQSLGLSSLSVEDNKLMYSGELDWHTIVDKLVKAGFTQESEFSKMCGGNSYQSQEPTQEGFFAVWDKNSTVTQVPPSVQHNEQKENKNMPIKKFDEFEENGVVVETHNTPVDLVIVGADTTDGGGSRDIAVTDDEQSVSIQSGNSKPIYFETEGHISILTVPQYEGWLKYCRSNGMEPAEFGIVDAVLLNNFVGEIRVTIKDDDGNYMNGFHLNDYILHQVEDAYDVTIELPSGVDIHRIKDHDLKSVIPYIRDKKIDSIIKDDTFADDVLKNIFGTKE